MLSKVLSLFSTQSMGPSWFCDIVFGAWIEMFNDVEDVFDAQLKLVQVICANLQKLQKLSKSCKTCKSCQRVIWRCLVHIWTCSMLRKICCNMFLQIFKRCKSCQNFAKLVKVAKIVKFVHMCQWTMLDILT